MLVGRLGVLLAEILPPRIARLASNCSTGNRLSNFNKRISSKSSNWKIWARWGFPTVSSPLPKREPAQRWCRSFDAFDADGLRSSWANVPKGPENEQIPREPRRSMSTNETHHDAASPLYRWKLGGIPLEQSYLKYRSRCSRTFFLLQNHTLTRGWARRCKTMAEKPARTNVTRTL